MHDEALNSGTKIAPAITIDQGVAINRPSTRFFAHSVEGASTSEWQRLDDHLNAVGMLSGQFGAAFGAEILAGTAGLLHDLGKYTAKFQDRLHGSPERVDHSTWGARVPHERYDLAGHLISYAIAGHHAGLANGKGI